MSSFHDCRKLENKSIEILKPFLSEVFEGSLALTSGSRLAIDLQKLCGDAIGEHNGKMVAVEFKAEEKVSNNLFIETWSNKSRHTTGWIYNLQSDYLVYHFVSVGKVYVCPMKRLKEFCFDHISGLTKTPGRLNDYPEKRQRKHSQANDTWGRLIPIHDLLGYRAVYLWLDLQSDDGPLCDFLTGELANPFI